MKLDLPDTVFYAMQHPVDAEKEKIVECIDECTSRLNDIDAKFSHDPEDAELVKRLLEERSVLIQCWYAALTVLRRKAIESISDVHDMINIAHHDSTTDPTAIDALAKYILENADLSVHTDDGENIKKIREEVIRWEYYDDLNQWLDKIKKGSFELIRVASSKSGWVKMM